MTPSQSEEDPFNNIPDLSVSETGNNFAQVGTTCHQPTAETLIESDEAEDDGRPMTCASSVPSKDSNNFGWSFEKTETRATSCSTQGPRKRSIQRAAPPQTTYAIPESDEGEIAILRYHLPNVRSGILADDGRSHRITTGSLSGALVSTILPIRLIRHGPILVDPARCVELDQARNHGSMATVNYQF